MSNFQLCAIGWQRFCGPIGDGRPGGRAARHFNRRKATQELPRQLLHGSPFHFSFQRDRRTLATTTPAWTCF